QIGLIYKKSLLNFFNRDFVI
ncbi:Cation efflux system protein CusC precursor, partial [Haemophilus influenzae]